MTRHARLADPTELPKLLASFCHAVVDVRLSFLIYPTRRVRGASAYTISLEVFGIMACGLKIPGMLRTIRVLV